jgi:hypothetical protein
LGGEGAADMLWGVYVWSTEDGGWIGGLVVRGGVGEMDLR